MNITTPYNEKKKKKTKDSSSMATILNDYFASVFTRDHDDIIPDVPEQQFNNELITRIIYKHEVEAKLKNLKDSPSSGPDGIPSLILKRFFRLLSGPLTVIYNKSLQSSTVPDDWKLGNVTPIYKQGNGIYN